MLEWGVEMRNGGPFGEKPDEAFTRGTLDVFNSTDGDLVVHGPVGKWVIAAGEALFGGADSSVGWRFSVCLLGTISIFMLGRIARRRSTLARRASCGTCAHGGSSTALEDPGKTRRSTCCATRRLAGCGCGVTAALRRTSCCG